MPADKKHVMDVMKPGKAAATATSRPVIVGHGAMIKDPMVHEKGSEAASEISDSDAVEAKSPSATKLVIKPLEAEEKAVEAEEKPVKDADSSESAVPAETPKDEPKKEEEKSDDTDDESDTEDDPIDGSDKAIVEAVSDQAKLSADEKKRQEQEAAEAEAINKLIEDKTYFISVGQVRRHRNNQMAAVLLLVILFALVIGYILVDTGVLNLGFDVPVHLLGH